MAWPNIALRRYPCTMELYQLKAFVQVAREGNLSRAAVKLFTSQPAVSAQIKALEETLGISLFERTPKGMVLTRQGEILREEAEKALAAAQGVLQRARGLRAEPEGVLRLGTISDPVTLRLGALFAGLASRYPKIDIHLNQGHSGTVSTGILGGTLDAGYVIGEVSSALTRISLMPVRVVVIAPKRFNARGLGWNELCALPWVGVPDNCSFQRLYQELFSRMGQEPADFVARADQEHTLASLIAAGLGLCLMREDQARLAVEQGIGEIWPGAAIDSDLAFVFRPESRDEPCIAALLELVREIWPTTSESTP